MTGLKKALLLFSIICISSHARSDDIELIDNSPIQFLEESVTQKLVNIRPITGVNYANVDLFADIRFTKEFIVQSAMQFPEIIKEIEERGVNPEDLSFEEITDIVEDSKYVDIYLYNDQNPTLDNYKNTKIVRSDNINIEEYKIWDAKAVMNMYATGVIDSSNIDSRVDGSVTIEYINFKPIYIDNIKEIYRRLELVQEKDIADVYPLHYDLISLAKQYNTLEKSLLQNIGDITFGHPIIFTKDEKNLVVPNYIDERYDVVWLELAATFREIDMQDIEEMAINYQILGDGIALELIPLQFGPDVNVSDEYGTPEIGVEYKDAKLTVGEFFRRSVAYNYIKPTIFASGLRERQFSWTIKDEAMRAGSHKFVAILGVPKGEKDFQIGMSAHVRLKKGIFDWSEQGAVAGTESFLTEINF